MIVSGSVSAVIDLDETVTAGVEKGSLNLSRTPKQNILNGTASGQCDLKWSAPFTLAAGASMTLTVSALTDALGRPVPLRRAKVALIETEATLPGDVLTFGGAASNPWAAFTDGAAATFTVPPLGFSHRVAMGDGWLIQPGSSDQLKVTNSGTHPITFRITLAGCSA